ncbi:MAG: hypothetical protein FJZ16_03645 [Candidatus Omnitrophica bacterium]|nr:hypothetical protein [Candidatus Omnitrophota bacterium]
MDIEKKWQDALKNTEIIRSRLMRLYTFETTELPYIFLAESSVNQGDTVVRKGNVSVDKPLIVLPRDFPIFEGFEFKENLELDEDIIRSFFLVRGVRFPSLKYQNLTLSLDIYEGSLKEAIKFYVEGLKRKEDITSALIVGNEEAWQFSILIYVAFMFSKSADEDIRKLFEKFKRDKGLS